jgi:hypothetical protein
MHTQEKVGAATNNPINAYTRLDYTRVVKNLQALRNVSWQHAIKYRFDPTIGTIHNEYLTILNEILDCVVNEHVV